MNIKNSIYILGFFTILGVVFAEIVLAQNTMVENIHYPIPELGNCGSKTSCKSYCDKPENSDDCMFFALQNNLMSQEEITKAKKFKAAAVNGPGGCKTDKSCKEYCDGMNHIDECISFAEKHDLIPQQKMQEAKKVQAAIAKGIKPPNCKNKEECDVYCDNTAHMQECIAFGQAVGLLEGKKLENAQKVFQAIQKGVTPPPCRGKKECDQYCSNPDNMKICMNFSMQAGLMSEEEKTNAQKMLAAVNKGVRPPNCRGKEECDNYCQQDDHMDECTSFAVAAGMMTEENAKMAKKTGGRGPGGCRDKEECDAFCIRHQEECLNFAKENGMMPAEELQKIEMNKNDPINQPGPGGCMGSKECQDYCDENQDECKKFQPEPGVINPGGNIMPPQAGPGGCRGAEECDIYCRTHPKECKNFGSKQDENRPIMEQRPGGVPLPVIENASPPSSFITPQSVLGAIISGIQLFTSGK